MSSQSQTDSSQLATLRTEPYKGGTVKHIKLVNFMCHDSFELDLGPRVNFIIGPNGSGKSAILTALVVCFGGRATITSRAKKNSDFVKYGKTYAKISLVVHNYDKIMEKEFAFKPDDYGKSITIEKTIFKDDAAKLALKNDKGKRISERKQELDDLIEHFGILINNPICILNQEISKTFLHSKRPEDKFDLFMKATNLEQIEQDYNEANKTYSEWNECNERKKGKFRVLDVEYEGCKEKVSFLENRVRLNETRATLNQELIWAIVRDNEELSKDIEKVIAKIDAEVESAKTDIERRTAKIKTFEEEVQLIKTNATTASERSTETHKKLVDIKAKDLEAKKERIELKHKIQAAEKRIAGYKEDSASLEKSIEDLKRKFRDHDAIARETEQKKIEIEALEKEIPSIKSRELTLRNQNRQLEEGMTELRSRVTSSTVRVNNLRTQLSSKTFQLQRLKNGQQNELRKYGDFVVKIRDKIEAAYKANEFKHKPLGPLGYYLKLKSQDIAGPLEHILGRNAHAFICDNYQDMAKLGTILKSFSNSPDFRQPQIIVRKFARRHDISRFKAHHDTYKALIDYLDIEQDPIYNVVIDKNRLENVLFIPDYKEAENLMINMNTVPQNTMCAYTRDCSQMFPRTAKTGYKSLANDVRGSLFASSNAQLIINEEREIETLKAELHDASAILKDLERQLGAQRAEWDANRQEVNKIVRQLSEAEERLLGLKTAVVNTHEPQELTHLEHEYESCLKNLDTQKVQVDKMNEDMQQFETVIRDYSQERDSCMDIIKHIEVERQGYMKMIEQTKASIADAQNTIKQREIIIVNRTKEKEEKTASLEESLSKLARSKQNIREGTRPANIRTTNVIKEDLRKIEAQLRVEDEDMRDPEDLKQSLKKRMKEIESLVILKDKNLTNFSATRRTLEDRKAGFMQLRSNTTSAVSSTFATVMRSMGMHGDLKIHLDDVRLRGDLVKKARTLEMYIDTNYTPSQRTTSVMSDSNNNMHERSSRSQPLGGDTPGPRPKRARLEQPPNSSEKENARVKMTDARSLSGGERSFSTVAFVLALWHHCVSPFKLMDEIDVFMDMVTRRISYNALIRFAELSEDPGQFIFFSPLELPKIDHSDTVVRVFEMPPVIRKQSQLQIAGDTPMEE